MGVPFLIGDSTLPGRGFEFGNPYVSNSYHGDKAKWTLPEMSSRWSEFLGNLANGDRRYARVGCNAGLHFVKMEFEEAHAHQSRMLFDIKADP